MKLYRFNEYNQKDLEPINSFHLKDSLNPKIWTNYSIHQDVRQELLKIADDYLTNLGFNIEISDIILTGSLANYNWSEYSDFDLHFVFDFSQINPDIELVKKFLDADRRIWNMLHNIKIFNYDVEIYSQNVDEPHTSTGVYSLQNDVWVVRPTPKTFEIDTEAIKIKAEDYMHEIDDIEQSIDSGDYNMDIIKNRLNIVWDKVKERNVQNGGEFSIENLVFKMLRRNGYIEKIVNLKNKLYDNQFK